MGLKKKSKNILIVAATLAEIKPLLDQAKEAKPLNRNVSGFELNGHHLDVLITGVGMTQTAYFLGKVLPGEYDLAINPGLAGSFDKELALGTVVNVASECFADLGAEDGENFLTLEDLKLREKDEFPFQDGLLQNNTQIDNNLLANLPKAKGITVNRVHGNEISIEKIKNLFRPDVESMEGAAFFYACLMEHVPFVELRTISNYVEKRDKSKWNIPLAVEELNKFVFEFIKAL